MCSNLRNIVKELNYDISDVANSEKAKKLRKTLLCIGIPMLVIGIVGTITCFVLFVIGGVNQQPQLPTNPGEGVSLGFPSEMLIPFFLIIPCFIIFALGVELTSLGLKIIATGFTSKLIDETVGNNCPNCGNEILKNNSFCPKCGTKLVKKCPNCNHENDNKSDYCVNCGTSLNDDN